jgi:transcriptional regulator with XRE-family HTH domain
MENAVVELDRSPNPVDRHVGLRIRVRRKELSLSQEKLADAVELTFQQIQKYERASNRVSASKLWEIARALQAPVSYFFEGLPEDGQRVAAAAPGEDIQAFLLSNEGLELLSSFPRIRDGAVRRRILDLVRALAESADPREA